MALTKAEKLLLRGLKLFELKRGNAMLVMMLMDTEQKRWDLMEYMVANQYATEDEILAKGHQIARI